MNLSSLGLKFKLKYKILRRYQVLLQYEFVIVETEHKNNHLIILDLYFLLVSPKTETLPVLPRHFFCSYLHIIGLPSHLLILPSICQFLHVSLAAQ
jgi:hypothetical protein